MTSYTRGTGTPRHRDAERIFTNPLPEHKLLRGHIFAREANTPWKSIAGATVVPASAPNITPAAVQAAEGAVAEQAHAESLADLETEAQEEDPKESKNGDTRRENEQKKENKAKETRRDEEQRKEGRAEEARQEEVYRLHHDPPLLDTVHRCDVWMLQMTSNLKFGYS